VGRRNFAAKKSITEKEAEKSQNQDSTGYTGGAKATQSGAKAGMWRKILNKVNLYHPFLPIFTRNPYFLDGCRP